MTNTLSLHWVTSVTVSDVKREDRRPAYYTRDILITMGDGQHLEITMFSDAREALVTRQDAEGPGQ